MPSLRESLQQKPWIGWVVAGILFACAIIMFFRGGPGSGGAYNPERMRESVTIRYSDTGEEEKLRRGAFEQRLRLETNGVIDPSLGLINPKTQKPTGFLVDTEGWQEAVERINAERKKYGDSGTNPSPTQSTRGGRTDGPKELPPGLPPATDPAATPPK